jgi:hypothetical protein
MPYSLRKLTTIRLIFVSIPLLLARPAAASIVFDNYPIDGSLGRLSITGAGISESFTLASAADVNGVRFGAWLSPGESITSVHWAIDTLPFGAGFGSGTASVSGTSISGGAFDIYDDAVSFADINLSAGIYYLTLDHAVTTSGTAGWDVNNVSGIDAWIPGLDISPGVCNSFISVTGSCAASFQILGAAAAVPEPAAWTMLGGGILATAFWRIRSRRKPRASAGL